MEVQWLDSEGNQIGPPGLDLFIPQETLQNQINYLTYLDITKPAPAGAVKARIIFNSPGVLRIDNVILARTGSTNLVQNPSFGDALNNWEFINTSVQTSDIAYEGNKVAEIASTGGALFQDIPITSATGHCFLLNFGYRRRRETDTRGNLLAEVRWLDNRNREIGLGLSLVINGGAEFWSVYTGITKPAPPGAVKAMVQFSHSNAVIVNELEIDKVVLARLS